MTEPTDAFEGLRFPIEPLAPRPEARTDLLTRLHRRLGLAPPAASTPMTKPFGLEYEVVGPADGEAVLFMHAGTATAFLPLMSHPALRDRYRLVRYHRRGYAGSDALGGDMSVAAHVQDALRLLEHLGIDSAHVVGHSGSGVIALQVALDAPQVVRSLVLEEPALGHAIEPRWRELVLDAIAPAMAAHRSGESRRAMELWMRGISPDWRVELTRTVPGGPQQTLDDAAAFMADVDAVFRWSLDRDRVASLEMPVLYVLGAESRPARAAMRRFRELVPHTQTAVIDDATHMLHTDQPGPVGDELAAFFGRNRVER